MQEELEGCEKTRPLMDTPLFLLPQNPQPCVVRHTGSAPWLEFGVFLMKSFYLKEDFGVSCYLSRQVVQPAFSNLTLTEVHGYGGRDVCHVPANFIMQ